MKCPRCQQANPAGQKFCGECGASLSQGAAAGKFASAETYTPQHLAEKILNSKAAAGHRALRRPQGLRTTHERLRRKDINHEIA